MTPNTILVIIKIKMYIHLKIHFKEDIHMSSKSRLVAALLCFFLGGFGIHRFYTGKIGTGIIWLLTGGLLGFGALVDFIVILVGSFKDKEGKTIKNW